MEVGEVSEWGDVCGCGAASSLEGSGACDAGDLTGVPTTFTSNAGPAVTIAGGSRCSRSLNVLTVPPRFIPSTRII